MNKSQLYKVIIVALVLVIAAYFFLFSLPTLFNLQIIGFEGKLKDKVFQITRILPGSPSESAELEVGDIITQQKGRGVEEWQKLYRQNLGKYLAERNEWRDSAIEHTLLRDENLISIMIQPRKLSHGDLLWLYFVRFFLSIILVGLALFIVFSNIKNKDGYLCALAFCFLVFWLLSGVRYWRGFFHPYLPNITLSRFLVIEPLFILSTHLVLSIFLHFSLVFPEEREFFKRNRWLAIPIYVLGPLILGISVYFTSGSLSERYSTTYNLRLWIFSIYLFLALFMLLIGYVACRSPLQRERSRWVVLSVAIAAGCYLILWNIPKLIIGRPLITNFDWLLLPLLLVPIAMTMSIDQYHLFGIQGMVRRRIRALEENILKEKQLASSRDEKIQKLSQEISQLQSELEKYAKVEFPSITRESNAEALENLQQKHPAIKALREERLIGKSPLWKEIFEEVLLASQGNVPVLITGESGTGKTDIAWAICLLGDRKDKVFKAISCAQFEHSDPAFALGKLFGIGKGHGLPNVPKEGQKGLLEECDGGTLFLDDLDRLPLSVQDLLLYPLEGKPFEPGIGAGPARKVSVKFIFATNQDLDQLVSAGRFRGDVLARIVGKIHVPSLRERPEDVPPLIEYFTFTAAQELKHDISVISPKAMNLLLQYDYSAGNVRELKSELYKAIGRAMLGGDHVLRAGYLSEELFSPSKKDAEDPARDLETDIQKGSIPIDLEDSRELAVLRKHRFQIKPSEKELGYSHKSRTLSNHLRGICIKALWESEWDFERATRKLTGTDDPTLIEKIKGKVNRFYYHIEKSVQSGTEQKLFNNLPADYHQAFHAAISHIRGITSSEYTSE